MSSDPLTLVLLHQYAQPRPAIDESPFLRHAACLNTEHLADGAKTGSGALAFRRDDSAVRVPMAPHWERLRGLVVDVMVRFEGDISARRNIVEGDGCFAFYVAAGGEVRFDFVSLVEGQGSATWNGVSSDVDAVGAAYRVQPGRWVHLQASFDGTTTARLRADGRLVAERRDFRSSLAAPGGKGVVIGNWTLRNQYALHGAIDWLAIRKIDDRAILRDFLGRVDGETQRAWIDFVNCLRARDGDKPLAALADILGDLLARMANATAAADEATRALASGHLARYASLWEDDLLADPAYAETLAKLRELLAATGGEELLADLDRVQAQFEDLAGERSRDCFERSGLAALDPHWTDAFAGMRGTEGPATAEARP